MWREAELALSQGCVRTPDPPACDAAQYSGAVRVRKGARAGEGECAATQVLSAADHRLHPAVLGTFRRDAALRAQVSAQPSETRTATWVPACSALRPQDAAPRAWASCARATAPPPRTAAPQSRGARPGPSAHLGRLKLRGLHAALHVALSIALRVPHERREEPGLAQGEARPAGGATDRSCVSANREDAEHCAACRPADRTSWGT